MVLGLALTALVVDKVVLGGGATPAQAADDLAVAPGATSEQPVGADKGARQTLTVAQQLGGLPTQMNLDEGPQLVDAFAQPRAFAELLAAEQEQQRLEERRSKAAELEAQLRSKLRLTATRTTGQPCAMINGTLYGLGSEITDTGYRVKEVDTLGVVLEDVAAGTTMRMELADTGYRGPKAD